MMSWEHLNHGADIGVRGIADTRSGAFEQAAIALTAVTADIDRVDDKEIIFVECEAPDDELLFVEWLNAVIYEMATRNMLFRRYEVSINGTSLHGKLWGETVDVSKHKPAVEIKGATYTELSVKKTEDDLWLAQTVVDV